MSRQSGPRRRARAQAGSGSTSAPAPPERSYERRVREQRASYFEDSDVCVDGDGHWQVSSQNTSDFYDVSREDPPCIRRRCTLQPCEHMYTCECPDTYNPCKHILKVHQMLVDGARFEGESDRGKDGEGSSTSARLPPPPTFSPQQRQQRLDADVQDIALSLNELRGFLLDPRFSIDLSDDIKDGLKKLVEDTKSYLKLPVRY